MHHQVCPVHHCQQELRRACECRLRSPLNRQNASEGRGRLCLCGILCLHVRSQLRSLSLHAAKENPPSLPVLTVSPPSAIGPWGLVSTPPHFCGCKPPRGQSLLLTPTLISSWLCILPLWPHLLCIHSFGEPFPVFSITQSFNNMKFPVSFSMSLSISFMFCSKNTWSLVEDATFSAALQVMAVFLPAPLIAAAVEGDLCPPRSSSLGADHSSSIPRSVCFCISY